MNLQNTLVSVVSIVNNDADIIDAFVNELFNVLSGTYKYFELLLVDNGSSDASPEIIQTLQAKLPNIRLLRLSRKYEVEIAWAAALENSIGDFVVMVNINHDPPALIPAMVDKATQGNDLVIAERQSHPESLSFVERIRGIAYRFVSWVLGYQLRPNTSYFRLLSRRVVNSITRIRTKNRYLRYFSLQVSFKQLYLSYEPISRRIELPERFSFFKAAWRALDIILTNSPIPLRLASILGMVASFISLLYFGYILVVTVVKQKLAEGWLTTNLMLTTMFFFLFLTLSIMSEYIARILDESKDRPLYFVEYETQSVETTYKREIVQDTLNVI